MNLPLPDSAEERLLSEVIDELQSKASSPDLRMAAAHRLGAFVCNTDAFEPETAQGITDTLDALVHALHCDPDSSVRVELDLKIQGST
jgi:hypothetical protein